MQGVQGTSKGDKFEPARAAFEALIAHLSEPSNADASHAWLEETLRAHGFEVLRLLYQAWLDGCSKCAFAKRAAQRREKGESETSSTRSLETLFGRVSIPRPGLKKAGQPTRFELDAVLQLPNELYSLPLRRRVVDEVTRGSFEQAHQALARTTAAHVPKRQLEQLARRAARDFDDFYANTPPPPSNDGDVAPLLIVTSDSKGIEMLPASLRPKTRKNFDARKARNTPHDPLRPPPGHKCSKRLATVTAVYEQALHHRTADDVVRAIMRDDRPPTQDEEPLRPRHKRVAASVEKLQATSLGEMLAEAQRRNRPVSQTLLALVDGDDRQLRLLGRELNKRHLSAVIIVDVMHVLHYLWDAAASLCGRNARVRQAFVRELLTMLLTQSAARVVARIRERLANRKPSSKQRKTVERCANYIEKRRRFMKYRAYLAAGYPIATGVVEGTCRHLVNDRMDITGARWSVDGAEAILRLRAVKINGDTDDYWAYHLKREHARIYARTA